MRVPPIPVGRRLHVTHRVITNRTIVSAANRIQIVCLTARGKPAGTTVAADLAAVAAKGCPAPIINVPVSLRPVNRSFFTAGQATMMAAGARSPVRGHVRLSLRARAGFVAGLPKAANRGIVRLFLALKARA